MRRWGKRTERGQGLVEFALVVPMLLLILMAIIDFGRIFQANVTLTNAVREGARWGSRGYTASESQSRITEAAAGLPLSGNSVTIPGTAGEQVTATASMTVTLITPIGPLMGMVAGGSMNSAFTLTRTAVMRRE